MTTEPRQAWVCLGETDEYHPFCPFATTDPVKAAEHGTIPGHWLADDVPAEGMWAESLRLEQAA